MRELARRLKPHGIVTASTNPGAVVSPLTHGRVDELVGWTPQVSFRIWPIIQAIAQPNLLHLIFRDHILCIT